MNMKFRRKTTAILIAAVIALMGAACSVENAIADDPAAGQEPLTPVALPEGERDHYAIAMTIDTDSCVITEDIVLTVHNYSDDEWREIVIRDYMAVPEMYGDGVPSGEGISAVTLENGEALVFTPDQQDASVVRIALNAPLAPRDTVAIRLVFSAAISDSGARCRYGSLTSRSGASNDGNESAKTIELSQCFPILAVYENGEWVCPPYFTEGECMYSRCADYDISLSLPAGWVVVATGEERQAENGSNADWFISAQNVRDMALIASNELSVLSEVVGGMTINSYYGSRGEMNRLQGEESLRIGNEAAAFYLESFGAYPYWELDVVQSCNEVGGIEAPGIIRISRIFAENLGPTGGDADSRLLGDNVAHETAHQWFYAVVGNNQYSEAWLDEGFASAASLLYAKDSGWGQAYVEDWLALVHAIYEDEGSKTYCIDRPYDELGEDYWPTVYRRAAEFLYRLSEAMGEDEFLRFLSGYYSEFSFREATTSDFLTALEPYISGNDAARELVEENIAAAN